ncbi:hypothetical protein MPHL43072_17975 [Mycolicibacterium phlei DSM 43072]|uniref:Thiolase C-terminal domain-containing protein n=1 Tax=Mycolicibacterium phlei DSM 43239 = CCUG 21000 TaxID=1226750 RepID=A0A5N5V3L4_MYCPH|nr:hypothetical protein MPHL21000_14290 [Mycolicibacterium phlei DSM 43239 = CCUG 21000]KXW61725.1 hypothetical protein MPHL43239_20185 [Mycolicibacterium phlei DSM 43239 = CCUG 21000]KXW65650.1 hypothetical protein MPHL43070_05550 [Mycolicibacterium phlei DSM 43070]KXW71005.1 hypothetical protein MPHL43072_17975 [Mycolicibacterium phlei DSM 43072]
MIGYEDLGFAECFGGHRLVDVDNQVDGARIGLAHNIGGPTAVAAVTILEGVSSGTS